jgi:hypothetical protein
MFPALRAMLRDPEAKVLAMSAIGIIAVGSVVYMLVEHWGPIDAVYFCVVTLATVGYGDLHPTTDVGKVFTVFYILGGLGIIAGFVTELARQRGGRRIEAFEERFARPSARVGGGPDRTATPGGVVDAQRADRDPDSPRTDVGPGG